MASSFRSILEGLANSGQNAQLQKQIGQLVRSGAIDKRQATNLFGELVPIATKNQKPPEPLSPSELANVKEKFANLEGGISVGLVSRAIQNGQISNDEAMEYNRRYNKIRGRGASKAPSTTKKSLPSKQSGSSAPSSQSGSNLNREGFTELLERIKNSRAKSSSKSKINKKTRAPRVTATAPTPADTPAPRVTESSAPSSQSGSNLNREGFTELLKRIKESKARSSPNTAPTPADTPAPRVTGPAFKSVNTPVTNPDAPTNNVTKPTGAAAGPKPQNKKQSKLISDIANIDNLNLTNEQKNDLKFNRVQADNNNSFNRGDFKFLLDKLEGSKIRQNRDAQSQERKNIYSRGLSSMFANF